MLNLTLQHAKTQSQMQQLVWRERGEWQWVSRVLLSCQLRGVTLHLRKKKVKQQLERRECLKGWKGHFSHITNVTKHLQKPHGKKDEDFPQSTSAEKKSHENSRCRINDTNEANKHFLWPEMCFPPSVEHSELCYHLSTRHFLSVHLEIFKKQRRYQLTVHTDNWQFTAAGGLTSLHPPPQPPHRHDREALQHSLHY